MRCTRGLTNASISRPHHRAFTHGLDALACECWRQSAGRHAHRRHERHADCRHYAIRARATLNVAAITGFTIPTANAPAVITANGHGLVNGDRIYLSGVVGIGVPSRLANGSGPSPKSPRTPSRCKAATGCLRANGFLAAPFIRSNPPSLVASRETPPPTVCGMWKSPGTSTIKLHQSVGNGAFGGTNPIWWVVPKASQFAIVQCQTGDINWLADGTDPVVGDGGGNHMVANDTPLQIEAAEFLNFRMINYNAVTGAKVLVNFCREM